MPAHNSDSIEDLVKVLLGPDVYDESYTPQAYKDIERLKAREERENFHMPEIKEPEFTKYATVVSNLLSRIKTHFSKN